MPYLNDTQTTPLRRLPDFFPTPPELCDHLVELADIPPRSRVLEPSAGRGDLALALRRARVEPHCLEIQPRLVALLQRQGFAVRRGDFLRLPSAADLRSHRPKPAVFRWLRCPARLLCLPLAQTGGTAGVGDVSGDALPSRSICGTISSLALGGGRSGRTPAGRVVRSGVATDES